MDELTDPRINPNFNPYDPGGEYYVSATRWDLDVCSIFCMCGLPQYTPYVPYSREVRVNFNDCECNTILSQESPFKKWILDHGGGQQALPEPGRSQLVLPLTAANISLLQRYKMIGEGDKALFNKLNAKGEIPYKLIPDGSIETIYNDFACYPNVTVG